MSVTQSARGLLARRLVKTSHRPCEASRTAAGSAFRTTTTTPTPSCQSQSHGFHTSPTCRARKKRFSSVQAEKMGLVTPKKTNEFAQRHFPRLKDDDYSLLKHHYTPQQMAAIKAGEEAIDPKDLAIQGRWRTDAYKFPYWDDFANYLPSIDKFPKPDEEANVGHVDPRSKWMTQKEFDNDFAKFIESRIPDGLKEKALNDRNDEGEENDYALKDAAASFMPNDRDLWDFVYRSKFAGGYQPEKQSLSSMAPALPAKVPGVAGLYNMGKDGEGEDQDEGQDELAPERPAQEKHGWSEKSLEAVALRMMESKRVTNQTRLGKVYSTRYTVIAGNGDGWLGVGMAKGLDTTVTPLKAKALAILNLKPIRRYENRTIYGNTEAKFGGTQVKLFARPPGFGLRVPNNIFHICRFAGLKDLAAKMPRAANKMNTVKAVVEALHNQKDPEQIARGRGKKLVDVRKVYYGGLVY